MCPPLKTLDFGDQNFPVERQLVEKLSLERCEKEIRELARPHGHDQSKSLGETITRDFMRCVALSQSGVGNKILKLI